MFFDGVKEIKLLRTVIVGGRVELVRKRATAILLVGAGQKNLGIKINDTCP
jgi:hypothetical protein